MTSVTTNPHVVNAVDLLTAALLAAGQDAAITQRYIRSELGVTRDDMVAAQEASRAAQVAAQHAIYDLAASLSTEFTAVAS